MFGMRHTFCFCDVNPTDVLPLTINLFSCTYFNTFRHFVFDIYQALSWPIHDFCTSYAFRKELFFAFSLGTTVHFYTSVHTLNVLLSSLLTLCLFFAFNQWMSLSVFYISSIYLCTCFLVWRGHASFTTCD